MPARWWKRENYWSPAQPTRGVRVSYDVLLAKSLAAALLAHPALNATIEGDAVVQLAEAHIGVAVAVEDGLVVPVLRDAAPPSGARSGP